MKQRSAAFLNLLRCCIAGFSCFLLLPLPAAAQMQYSSANISQLTVEDGLSQSVVYSIAQDAKGFMWFATFNGLDRYDGKEFVHFRHNDQDSFSLSSSLAYSLFTDSKGRLWAGTYDKGLNYFDAATRHWYHFMPHELISEIQEDADGGLYVCHNEMVTHITLIPLPHRKEGEPPFRIDTAMAFLPRPVGGPPTIDYVRLFADRQRRIYCTSRTGLYSLAFNAGTHAIVFTPLFTYPRGWQIPSFLQDANTGKYYLNTADGVWESNDSRFRHPVTIHASTPYYSTFYIDKHSRLWYNSGERLDTLNLLTGREGLVTSLSNATGNVYAQLTPLMQDRNGTLWMRTPLNGIVTYADDENYFHTLLRGTFVNPISQMTDTTCLVNNTSVLNFGKNGITITKREKKESDFFQNVYTTRYGNAKGWYIKDTMLIHYDPATAARRVRPIPYRRFGFSVAKTPGVGSHGATIDYSLPIFPAVFDYDSCLWLSCPRGFAWYDMKKDSFHYSNQGIFPEDFYEDKEHVIWMNANDGIYACDKTTSAIRFFARTITTTGIGQLPAKTKTVFCDDPLDPKHIIWLGTHNGLYRMDKTTGKCRRFTTSNGLPDDLVYSLLRDEKKGDLWLSTNGGLTRLNASSFSIRNFSEADGLQGREFNTGSALQLKNGIFMFGGTQGISYFYPEQISMLPPPDVVITGCQVLGRPVKTDASGRRLPDMAYARDISISYQDNIITFTFAGIDYRKKKGLQYRYRLAPFDKEWRYTENNPEATYTNLDPGDYTFVAESSNSIGVWGTESEALHVHVLPLWWQTWWCKAGVILVALLAFYIFYRYRLRKALEVERVRNRIASDLHDEIGSTLSAITLFSDMAQRQSETAIPSPQLLKRINETSQKVTQTMRDIVWSVSTKNDSFDKMITHMHEHAAELLNLKDYELHFTVDEKLNTVHLSMEKRQNLYLIYKEALNNIIKYADGKNVWISLRRDKAHLLLTVKDDGRGFHPDISNNGNGLGNMKKRAAFTGGSAVIHSAENSGCEVVVRIPV